MFRSTPFVDSSFMAKGHQAMHHVSANHPLRTARQYYDLLSLLFIDLLAETGTKNDRDISSNCYQVFGQIFACHIGHGLVGEMKNDKKLLFTSLSMAKVCLCGKE